MENIGEHQLHINNINDNDKSNISEDLSAIKEKRTGSLKGDRSGVCGDGAVFTEKRCDEEEEIDDSRMNIGYLLMKHAWNHMYQTIQLK